MTRRPSRPLWEMQEQAAGHMDSEGRVITSQGATPETYCTTCKRWVEIPHIEHHYPTEN